MKKFFLLLLLPVTIVLAAAVIAPKLASEAHLRSEVEAALRQATGSTPRIEGPIALTILPWPAITVERTELSTADAHLVVPQMKIVLDLLPLLAGQAKADHLELAAPELTISEHIAEADGLMGAIAGIGTSTFAGKVQVSEGRVFVRRGGEREVLFPTADLAIAWRGARDLSARGKLVWREQPLELDFSISNLARLAMGDAASLRLAVSGPPAKLAFQGAVKLAGGPVAEGALTASSNRLREALEWAGVEAPTEQGFGPFALNAQVHASDQGASLSGVRLQLDGNVGEGGFNLRMEGGRAIVQGTLAGESVDLTPYGEIIFFDPDRLMWNEDIIDLDRLSGLDLDLRFSATQVEAGAGRFQRVAASAVLKSSKLSLTIGDAEAWDGLFRAAIQIAPHSTGVGTDTRIDLVGQNVSFAKALGEVFIRPPLEGKGNFRMTARGAGENIAEIVSGLQGSFTLDGEQGALVGVDVGRVLARLEQRPLSGMADLRGGRTPFEVIRLVADVENGVAKLTQFALESSRVRVEMTGECSILKRSLDLTGVAGLRDEERADKIGFRLPFVVRGDLDNPVVLPDAQALIRRSGAARPLFGDRFDAMGVAGTPP